MARRIVLQEPESGLDVFLKELSRYASPQYQLSLREQERADARLELSKRQMSVNEERYQNSLEQQRFQNERAIASENRAEEQFQFNKRNSEYAIARQNIDDAFSGLNPRQRANMNIDSLVIGIKDPTVNLRSRKYAESLMNRGNQQFERISSTLNIYNSQNPESPMTLDTALDVFRDDKSINKVFTDAYFSKGDLNDKERAKINSNTTRLTSLRKRRDELQTEQTSLGVDNTDKLAQNAIAIQNLQGGIDKILKPFVDDSTGTTINPYENTGSSGDETIIPTKKTLTPPVRIFDPIESSSLADVEFEDQELYNILFADEEDMFESAVDIANRNASGEDVKDITLLQDESIDKYDPTDESLDEESAIPPSFLESALSGLSTTQASQGSNQETPKPKTKLFEESKIPSKLKNPRYGSEFIEKKTNKLKKVIKQSEEAPNKQTRKNLKDSIPRLKKELKDLLGSIYDESTNVFFDDNSEFASERRKRFPILKDKPLLYREFLNMDTVNYIKSL